MSMEGQVLETLGNPDVVQEGDGGVLLPIRLYPSTPLTCKYLVVPYREVSEEDGFVMTAYLTSSPSATREVLWTRSGSWRIQRL
jgi:hypothetical protein